MKKLGLVGGFGPESTADYYFGIIAKYQERIGNQEVLPEFFINSMNMYKVFEFIEQGNLTGLRDYLVMGISQLEKAGADFAVISANTPHIVFDDVKKRVNLPLYSIVEETVKKANELNLKKLGLIGTGFTMKHDFYKLPFIAEGKEIVVPSDEDQQYIHQTIVDELEKGIVNDITKERYLEIIREMEAEKGIEGIILGCTELPMIIKEDDLSLPQLNTTEIHIGRIVDLMFS